MDIPKGIRAHLQMLARQSCEMTEFAVKALGLMGWLFGVRLISLYIREEGRDRAVIHLTLIRSGGGWRSADGLPDRPQACLRTACPRYLLHSYFCFFLELSPRWSGSFLVEYPGIKRLSRNRLDILLHLLSELKAALHTVLMSRELARLEEALAEKERINQELSRSVTHLTKEAYCVSSVITGLSQSVNGVHFFTRILGSTLPLLKAGTGLVHFPETGRCAAFQSAGGHYHSCGHDHGAGRAYAEETCVKRFFDQKRHDAPGLFSEDLSLTHLNVTDPALTPAMKSHLRTLGVRSLLMFALRSAGSPFCLGLIGFAEEAVLPDKERLFMITLNMTGLFLDNISLMKNLERQVKHKSHEILKMEKRQKFVFDQVSRPFLRSKLSHSSDQILEKIDSSRRAVFLGELASGVAHQIRNPLNNLIAVLHLIKNQDIMGRAERGRLLDEVTSRVETIHQMINKFIHYTRIPELNLTSESVNEVLENTLQTFKGRSDLEGVAIVESFDPRLAETKMDLYLMNQAYHNIIENAVEAMQGQGRGTLSVSTRKLEVKHGPNPRLKFAEISFRDSGPGIAQGDIKNVLTPFFSRKKEGIGLGLAIVDHIVGLHGGGVRVENLPEAGVNVSVYLPIR